MNNILQFAPLPEQAIPLVHFTLNVFVTRAPFETNLLLDAHTDPGSGVLSFGVGERGCSVGLLLHRPTKGKEVPVCMKGMDEKHAFGVEVGFDSSAVDKKTEVHHVQLRARGECITLPAGYWHAVRSTGLRACVGYFTPTLDKS